ncbi:tRNA methyltransferase 10 A-like [Sarcoptes scabiei]|nr:tRNA methyltransferase 10 A-like [Sarcoptes scabiei]
MKIIFITDYRLFTILWIILIAEIYNVINVQFEIDPSFNPRRPERNRIRESLRPYLAAIIQITNSDRLSFVCSATYIDRRYVLTNGFCRIEPPYQSYRVVIGGLDFIANEVPDEHLLEVLHVIKFSNVMRFLYDIALVEMTPFQKDNEIAVMPEFHHQLSHQSNPMYGIRTNSCYSLGYTISSSSAEPQELATPILSQFYCQRHVATIFRSEIKMCAGYSKEIIPRARRPIIGAQYIGGGLFCKFRDDSEEVSLCKNRGFVLIGVAIDLDVNQTVSVYSQIRYFSKWIRDKILPY